MVPELGGWNIDTWIDKVSSEKHRQDSDLRISKDDTHPNKKGHEKIAELLYNEVINDPLIS
jgi:lysophospholipase L1-like esterase